MRLPSIISTLLFLAVFASCSTAENVMPPEYLLERARPLPRPDVKTNRQLVERTLSSERSYDEVAARLNALIDWLRETTT